MKYKYLKRCYIFGDIKYFKKSEFRMLNLMSLAKIHSILTY